MRLLNIKNFKTIAALGTMVFFMSCTNDLATTTGGLVNNDNFIKDTISIDPLLSTVNIDTVRTNLMPTYLLGHYTDDKLGTLNAGIVGQIVPDYYPLVRTTAESPSDVVSSDVEVTLELPIPLVNKDGTTDKFEIPNLAGSVAESFDVTVSTFTTYLEYYNEDATTRIYYSDGTNNAASKENLGTETVIGTKENIGFIDEYSVAADTLKITLDPVYFEDKLNELDNLDISNSEDFKIFFKGLKITTTKNGEGVAVPFDLSVARLKITYKNTNTSLETEGDKLLTFKFQGVLYNLYDHDHVNSTEVNKTYVQGAGGYETSIDISSFVNQYSTDSQNENWLINQAKIRVYLDDVEEIDDKTLQDFYIYGIKSDGSLDIIDDYITLGVGSVNGLVTYEDIENETNPYMEFYITDYIKNALAEGEIAELRIKARESSEGSSIVLSSSVPKGALLLNDLTSSKAPELEVIYSRIVE